MINIKVVEVLKRKGYDMADINLALKQAETNGESYLDGWCIRYNKSGEMIILHPSQNGIYIGDYNTHLIFQKNLSFSYANIGFKQAKHGELERVLALLVKHTNTEGIYCECPAYDYNRRVKQIEKLGYRVLKTNIDKVEGISSCHFLIACDTGHSQKILTYSPEDRENALQVSLTALASSLGYTPQRQGIHYFLKEMDSLVIYNDRTWYRWSGKGNRTGGTQIDFVMEFGNVSSVPEAIQYLLQFKGDYRHVAQPILSSAENESEQAKEMVLPPKNDNYRRLYAYLIKTRGLSQEVVTDFVHKKLIYEDAVHHNIVYCGYDTEGVVRYAGLRGTADVYGKRFKMDVPGNDKNYGVNIVNKASGRLLVFESVIDCMSYIDLYHDTTSNKLVLGMVEDNPLVQFLKDYHHIDTICFCLDNDQAAHTALYDGRKDAHGNVIKDGLIKKYEDKGYMVDVFTPPIGKDFNETLLEQKKSLAETSDNSELMNRRRSR